jgi:hypothetical protein
MNLANPPPSLSFQDFRRALRRHGKKAIVLFVAIVGIVALVTWLRPRTDRSVGSLFVRLGLGRFDPERASRPTEEVLYG